eukprot:m.274590 g.274590  ORF g.274590 m.274590 type:complete len:147 (-) comp15687_c0_seq1:3553-3993(-)
MNIMCEHGTKMGEYVSRQFVSHGSRQGRCIMPVPYTLPQQEVSLFAESPLRAPDNCINEVKIRNCDVVIALSGEQSVRDDVNVALKAGIPVCLFFGPNASKAIQDLTSSLPVLRCSHSSQHPSLPSPNTSPLILTSPIHTCMRMLL